MKNRELKFRAWDTKRMVYFDTLEIGFKKSKKVIPQVFFKNDTFNGEVRLGSHEVTQFTGLKDKNGKNIYEGDIVLCHDHPTGVDDIKGEVYFEQGAYKVKGAMPYLHDYGTAWTLVIGNIFENPELLK